MSETNKPVVKIAVVEPDEDPFDGAVLWGYAFGHPNFPDGTYVRTSRIVRRDGNTVETLNTIYELIDAPTAHQLLRGQGDDE